jgi:hypothetical protein
VQWTWSVVTRLVGLDAKVEQIGGTFYVTASSSPLESGIEVLLICMTSIKRILNNDSEVFDIAVVSCCEDL